MMMDFRKVHAQTINIKILNALGSISDDLKGTFLGHDAWGTLPRPFCHPQTIEKQLFY